MLIRAFKILLGVAVVAQMTGCFFVDRDRRHGYEHHEDHRDGVIDVHLHG